MLLVYLGPNLNGLFGRRFGACPEYLFTSENKNSTLVWEESALPDSNKVMIFLLVRSNPFSYSRTTCLLYIHHLIGSYMQAYTHFIIIFSNVMCHIFLSVSCFCGITMFHVRLYPCPCPRYLAYNIYPNACLQLYLLQHRPFIHTQLLLLSNAVMC